MDSKSLLLFCLLTACSDAHAGSGSTAAPSSVVVPSISDAPLAAYRGELLDLAFKAASAFPIKPHLKNRSRAQENVVEASLALDQPRRALAYGEKIDNWLRGVAYAEFACYCAQHGSVNDVEPWLERARKVSASVADDENTQDWQQDRIRATIAKAYAYLGQRERAELATDGFEDQLTALDSAVAIGNFEQVKSALQACTLVFDRFYSDVDRRSRVEEKIESSWNKMPRPIRVELTMTLAGFALGHEDHEKALALVNEGRALVDGAKWNPEDVIPLAARLAGLRWRAGDTDTARKEADAALALFESERTKIVDIFRAATLRPLAEAYRSMGDAPAALAVYKRAVEAGVENPNSRPRAEDLSATCCSMALHEVEPDVALKTRMTEICNGLGPPW
jgi:tetratricopeptide (TPR) repeat protein